MSEELTPEDLKRFKDFEDSILNLKSAQVKYKKDVEMEADIKKQALFSIFGKRNVESAVGDMKIDFIDLADQEIYMKIYKYLDTK